LSLPDNNGSGGNAHLPITPTSPIYSEMALNDKAYASPPPFDINFSLPFTTTYLRTKKQMRIQNGRQEEDRLPPDEDVSLLSLSPLSPRS
jgi:hypothetical protein